MIQKFYEMIRLLYEKTDRGGIYWEATVNGSTFAITITDFRISIGEDAGSVCLKIFNKTGSIIESVSDEEVPVISKVYKSARRQVMNADGAIYDLVESLSKWH